MLETCIRVVQIECLIWRIKSKDLSIVFLSKVICIWTQCRKLIRDLAWEAGLLMLETGLAFTVLFFNETFYWLSPASYSSFQPTNIAIFPTNIVCEKCPSSIWCWYLNPQPSGHESPLITTRPRLPPFFNKSCLFNQEVFSLTTIPQLPPRIYLKMMIYEGKIYSGIWYICSNFCLPGAISVNTLLCNYLLLNNGFYLAKTTLVACSIQS